MIIKKKLVKIGKSYTVLLKYSSVKIIEAEKIIKTNPFNPRGYIEDDTRVHIIFLKRHF
jgi:hypothetical protein